MPFGLQGSLSVLMLIINAVMTKGLRHTSAVGAAAGAGDPDAPSRADDVPGATGPLHHSVVVYTDNMLCYSPSLEGRQLGPLDPQAGGALRQGIQV
jgi:hypothetical protein